MDLQENRWRIASRQLGRGVEPDDYLCASRFTNASGWVFVAGIFLAPWAFGSRPYWAALSLACLLFLAVMFWFLGWALEKRLPAVPLVCWCAVSFLAVFAGISILNPQSNFDVALGSFWPNPAYLPYLPTTVDADNGWTFTLEMLGYLFVIPAVADLSRSAHWRRLFLRSIALNGILVAAAGMCLEMGYFPRLYDHLQRRLWAQGKIFGPFDYHGNAGAFLNLVLPAAAWNAATSSLARRLFWRCAVAVLYIALFVNSSRAALIIGVCLSPLCLWLILRKGDAADLVSSRNGRRWNPRIGVLAAAVLVLLALVAIPNSKPLRRLQHLPSELDRTDYARYLQSRAAWDMVQERPLFGAGVGSYKLLVQISRFRGAFFAPRFRPGDPFTVLGNTHEDYLQTLVEWGWTGFCAWIIVVGGAFVLLWRLLKRPGPKSRTGVALLSALLSVYVHAAGDCPLQIPSLQFLIALYLGLAWGSTGWMSASRLP